MSTHHLDTTANDVSSQMSIYIGEEERLFDRAERTATPREMVLAPTELHQRNLQRRLREAARPQNAFTFVDPETVAEELLAAADITPTSLDRVDRLAVLQSLPAKPTEQPPEIRSLRSTRREEAPQQLEQVRSEIEAMTNFHPDRIEAIRSVTDEFASPIADETTTLLDGGVAIERWIGGRTAKTVSKAALLRRATRQLGRTDSNPWTERYPDIERISLVGVSSISAPYVDLLHELCTATETDIEIHLRPGTGDFLTERLPKLLAIDDPGQEGEL